MGRVLNLFLLAVMLIGAIVTYDMKRQAEEAADRVTRLERDIARQKDANQLLRAELSMLLQPDRLQVVVERYAEHFRLEEFTPAQYATIDEIPFRQRAPTGNNASLETLAEDEMTIR